MPPSTLMENFYYSTFESPWPTAVQCYSAAVLQRTDQTCSRWWGQQSRWLGLSYSPALSDIYTGRIQWNFFYNFAAKLIFTVPATVTIKVFSKLKYKKLIWGMLGFYLKSRCDVVLWYVFVILRITKKCELVSEGLSYCDTQTEATFDLIIPLPYLVWETWRERYVLPVSEFLYGTQRAHISSVTGNIIWHFYCKQWLHIHNEQFKHSFTVIKMTEIFQTEKSEDCSLAKMKHTSNKIMLPSM